MTRRSPREKSRTVLSQPPPDITTASPRVAHAAASASGSIDRLTTPPDATAVSHPRPRRITRSASAGSTDRLSAAPTSSAESGRGQSIATDHTSVDYADSQTRTSESSDVVATPLTQKKKRVRVKTERRREQCRRNQARYRDKQRVAAIELEDYVEQLRLEVTRLQLQRQSLRDTIHTRDRTVHTMLEFFRLFRYGLTTMDEHTLQRRVPALDDQLAYITSAFDEHVRVDEARGRPFFLEQTRRFRTLYDGLVIELDRYEMLRTAEASTTINLKITMNVTISPKTIRYVFPHLLRPEYDEIRRKLLGGRLRYPSAGVLEFDERGLVVAARWTIDHITSMRSMLTLEEIAIVLQQALIAHDAYLLESGDEEPPDVDEPDYADEMKHEPYGDGDAVGGRYERDAQWDTRQVATHEADCEYKRHGIMDTNAYVDTNANAASEHGELIHDGKGDDFVMV